ncbi:MAG TPA: hypothetical protein VLT60_05480 [Usitatibacter sp.]|nr:hypothetical protein [Usitatibacter sp.]
MATNELIFAFVLVPAYLGTTFALSRTAAVRRVPMSAAFAINWLVAAAFLGTYTAMTGLAGGNWMGVSLFSGALAATLATALSTRFAPKPAAR